MCSTCAAKQQLMGYSLNKVALKPSVNIEDCTYSFEDITAKLKELNENGGIPIHISYLKSALNMWNKNCNLFKSQLDEVFK